jgi:hypothetical protein
MSEWKWGFRLIDPPARCRKVTAPQDALRIGSLLRALCFREEKTV